MLAPALMIPCQQGKPVDFNRQIRPLLSDKCFSCHGPDAHSRKADLRLDVEAQAHASGAIVPGKPGESSLVDRIHSTDSSRQMPPPKSGKVLTPAEKELLGQWIGQGGKFAAHWAYQHPVRSKVPAVSETNWPRNPIDSFLLARLEREKIRPSSDADPRTLIRRLHLDLTGLLPTPKQAADFVADPTDARWAAEVDRLLATDSHAERMTSWWLDLVRYADTVGYHGDQEHAASPYRDWVIDAFSNNMPFNRFTTAQLAGDLLPNPSTEDLTATCYNRLLQTSHEGGVQAREYRAIYAADRVRNLSVVWMGATIGCAQCHDHKYDPFSQKDFYALAACFADIDDEKHLRGGLDQTPTRREPEIEVHTAREKARIEELKALEIQARSANQPEKAATLEKQREALLAKKRRVMVTRSLASPREVRLLPRGNWLDDSGPLVQPAVPQSLRGSIDLQQPFTRLRLAEWLCDPKGAGLLTARIQVNRIWALFFGSGLSPSLEDLGAQGQPPSHPELLDYLALELVDNGWNLRHVIRLILTSRAYRQSSAARPELAMTDPENRLLASQSRWRLSAEATRDLLLQTSGLLNPAVGGPPARPYQPEGYYQYLNFPKRDYKADADSNQFRRGVYVHWQRQFLHPMLRALEAPSREECSASRPASTTPVSALALLNDPTCVEAARVLATRAVSAGIDDTRRLHFLFGEVLQRVPAETETRRLAELLALSRSRYTADPASARKLAGIGFTPLSPQLRGEKTVVDLASWTMVARAVLNLNESLTRE